MTLADLSEELQGILTDVFDVLIESQLIPIFDKSSVKDIFWKLASLRKTSCEAIG